MFSGFNMPLRRKVDKMKIIITIILLSLFSNSIWADDSFPGRKRYPNVPVIELNDLYQQLDNVVIIDARSKYEYETLRIKSAISIPLSLKSKIFQKEMLIIRKNNPHKKLVFYCNGHSCMKSYKATARAISYVGLNNVYAYDAGVFEWAERYPKQAMLLGKELKSTEQLLSKGKFKKHILPGIKFIKSADSSVAILDIRERIDRDGFYIFSGEEESISLVPEDKASMDRYLHNVKKKNKKLYVYDMVGKQVRWFQYYIESKGIKEYYFMKGGADAFFDIPIRELID